MNYKKHYDLLISKAQKRGKIVGYKEKHHIIPKSLGGSDDKSNIVELTAREHYLAHWLLFRIHKDKSTAAALHGMNQGNKFQKHRFIRSSRAYAESREFLAVYFSGDNNPSKRPEVRKKISKNLKGELNPMYGKTGELNPAYGMKHDPKFLRKKQLLHSRPVIAKDYLKNKVLRFQCVSDCAKYYNCTTKNILFRLKSNALGKSGKFKSIILTY